jgi:hypothetical protein
MLRVSCFVGFPEIDRRGDVPQMAFNSRAHPQALNSAEGGWR